MLFQLGILVSCLYVDICTTQANAPENVSDYPGTMKSHYVNYRSINYCLLV